MVCQRIILIVANKYGSINLWKVWEAIILKYIFHIFTAFQ